MVYTQEGVIKDSRPWAKIFAAGTAAITIAGAMFVSAFAAETSTVIVTSSNTQGWTSNQAGVAETRANGSVDFVSDADTPFGNGALQLKTGDSTASPSQDKVQYKKVQVTQLGDIQSLAYSTKQISASFAAGLPSYQLTTCLYGATVAGCNPAPVSAPTSETFTNFVYEPYVSEGNSAVLPNQWQTWDVSGGNFWSSRNIGSSSTTLSGYPVWSLDELKDRFPNATVTSFGVNVGSGNPNYDTRVDGVVFNDKLYDFELTAKTKEDCKNNGYASLYGKDGQLFKNQGQCVSSVQANTNASFKRGEQ
jgi:hypothetical protein